MSRPNRRRRKNTSASPDGSTPQGDVPEPTNVIDGIPDRSPRPAAWKYVLLGAIFAAWLAFLIYCQLAGGV
ncbi:MAG: hypothetical protein SVT52_02965 [Planctomycetota bacterium]|nr:hypothetical protein [Planctomycetota bacterium]